MVKSVYIQAPMNYFLNLHDKPPRWCNGAPSRGFDPRSFQTKDYTIGISSFSASYKEVR